MSARFTEAEAAQIDTARGTADRSVWLRHAALAYLTPAQARPPRKRGMAIPAKTVMPPVSEKLPAAPPVGVVPRRCTHQGTRIIGGYCRQCDHMIEPGGLWRT